MRRPSIRIVVKTRTLDLVESSLSSVTSKFLDISLPATCGGWVEIWRYDIILECHECLQATRILLFDNRIELTEFLAGSSSRPGL